MTTPPKTKKLFISYRSSDAAKVDKIARDLALLKHDDGTPRYITWQDKHNLPPASPNWWDAIVDAINDCHVFVFHMSRESLQSTVCLAELNYAYNLNRPIIPVVLEDEFVLDPKSGKYNIPYWNLVPDWLGEQQFLFYTGADFLRRFQQAIEMFERNWPREVLNVPRPLNPDNKSVHGTNFALYDAACDYAERLAFEDARKHFNALVRRNDRDFADVAAQWLELLGLYSDLIEINERRNARFIFNTRWTAYLALFPKVFLDGIFDPKGFATRPNEQSRPVPPVTPPAPPAPSVTTPAPQPKPVKLPSPLEGAPRDAPSEKGQGVRGILPPPFEWIEIPAGEFTMGSNPPRKVTLPTFWIAKYPVTNAQYAKFIDAGGYRQRRWWTDTGWASRENRTQPGYWTDEQFNGVEQPVVGVSWYEAVAFANWLKEYLGENITLPLEAQWEKAARGTDAREYPWGNMFGVIRCNTKESGIGKTTPVRQYEGKGDSPYGVVDMAGNVWEWCLDEYSSPQLDASKVNMRADTGRVLRGGSWYGLHGGARAAYRDDDVPLSLRSGSNGFRLLRAKG